MREFLIGVLLAATVVLGSTVHDIKGHLDALQFQINLVTNDVTRSSGCPQGVAVLAPGEDFYHPQTVMICQQK